MEDVLIRNTTAVLPGENGPEGRSCSVAVKDGREIRMRRIMA